jgi:SPP1 gp7 family putative phage head morphogenesis protein
MKPIRKDPAGFKTTELYNARILVGLIDDFEELVMRNLSRLAGRQLASLVPNTVWKAALVLPLPSDFMTLIDVVDQVETVIDEDPASRAADRVTWAAQAHGIAWAAKNLAHAGIEQPTATITASGLPSPAKALFLPNDKKMIDMAREAMVGEIKNLTGFYATGLKRELRTAWEKGETMPQIAKRIREVTGLAKNKAITIARTETLRAGNSASVDRYKRVGVTKVEWVTALDDRLCEECESLHGEIFDMDNIPDLPVHPNCRCTVVPIIEIEEE